MPYLEITEVVSIHSGVVNTSYRVVYDYTFVVLNKWFGHLLDISPGNFIFLKSFDSEFSYIEVWFRNQNSSPSRG